jgi:hypothetical protein
MLSAVPFMFAFIVDIVVALIACCGHRDLVSNKWRRAVKLSSIKDKKNLKILYLSRKALFSGVFEWQSDVDSPVVDGQQAH